MRIKRSLTLAVGASLAILLAPVAFVTAGQDNPQLAGVDQKTRAQQTTAAAAAAITDCKRQSAANAAGQDIFLSTATPRTYTGTAWQTVECTPTSFRLKLGERALVVSNFNAESDCNGSVSGQWCQTRALLNGAEGSPIASEPSSFAFDSAAGGVSNWQANSMGRAWEIRCGVQDGCQYKFQVQTRMHDSTLSGMWLDEIATHLRISYGAPAPL